MFLRKFGAPIVTQTKRIYSNTPNSTPPVFNFPSYESAYDFNTTIIPGDKLNQELIAEIIKKNNEQKPEPEVEAPTISLNKLGR